MTARATTENRLTPQPCAASNEPKDASHVERTCGCDVCAMARTIPVRAPERPPCQ